MKTCIHEREKYLLRVVDEHEISLFIGEVWSIATKDIELTKVTEIIIDAQTQDRSAFLVSPRGFPVRGLYELPANKIISLSRIVEAQVWPYSLDVKTVVRGS